MYFEETGAYNKPTNRTILEKLTNSFSDYWFCFIHLFCPLLLGNQHKDYAPPFLTQKYSSFSIHLTNVLFQVLISLAWTTVSQWSTFLSALPPPCLFMHMCVCVCARVCTCTHTCTHTLSRSVLSDFATPWTIACQAPLSLEFPRQEYWSGLHLLFQGTFLTQGSNPHLQCLLYWQEDSLPLSYLGSCAIQ